jgi:hypothetical protein
MKMAATKKMPVTARAVIQRVNRRLRRDHRMLRVKRGGRAYVIDQRNGIVRSNIDIEGFARELGVLRDWEALASCSAFKI